MQSSIITCFSVISEFCADCSLSGYNFKLVPKVVLFWFLDKPLLCDVNKLNRMTPDEKRD